MSTGHNDNAPIDVGFSQASEQMKLQMEWIQTIAAARLQHSKADSIDAHVVNQNLTNYTKYRSIREMEQAVHRWNAARVANEREIGRLRKCEADLCMYSLGDTCPGGVRQNMWAAFDVLSRLAGYEWAEACAALPLATHKAQVAADAAAGRETTTDNPEIMETFQLHSIFDMRNWVLKSFGDRPTDGYRPEAAKDQINNVLELLMYQYKCRNGIVVVRYSFPHMRSMAGLHLIEQHFVTKVTQLKAAIADAKKENFDPWNIPTLVTLQDSPV